MKNIQFKNTIYFWSLVLSILSACQLSVLENPVGSPDTEVPNTPSGTAQLVTSLLKSGFDAHQNIMWCASLVGQEELKATGASGQFLFADQIASQNTLDAVNTQNLANMRGVYTTFSLARLAEQGIAKNTFSANPADNQRVKDLLTAHVKMIRGLMYADMAKFYKAVPVYKTTQQMTPEQAKDSSIVLLTQARDAWTAYNLAPFVAPPLINGTDLRSGFGLLGTNQPSTPPAPPTNLATSAIKFCNSYIGMIYFDMGPRASASAFLANGYTSADGTSQIGFRTIGLLTGNGIYPLPQNFAQFSVNDYSDSFVANRIPGDVARRAPTTWFDFGQPVASRIGYFFPVGFGAQVVRMPLITWGEVQLMRVELGEADHATTVRSLLSATTANSGWNMTVDQANAIATDVATYPLERIARYEYIYRGRRWSYKNNLVANTYARWDLSSVFNLN
jgi:hypothetical protein